MQLGPEWQGYVTLEISIQMNLARPAIQTARVYQRQQGIRFQNYMY